eukprot:401482-Pelagomonas_calceolata.AAC.1
MAEGEQHATMLKLKTNIPGEGGSAGGGSWSAIRGGRIRIGIKTWGMKGVRKVHERVGAASIPQPGTP